MKKIVILLVVLSIVALGITPFFVTQNTNDALSVGASIISALASIITLLIALLLYSKYGVEKSLVAKQTEVVFSLFEELKKTRLVVKDKESMLQLFLHTIGRQFSSDYKNKNIMFSRSYFEGLNNIWQIAEDIFLPTEIAVKIRPLMVQLISGVKSKSKHMLVVVPGYVYEGKDDFFGKLNNRDMTLQEFVNQWESVIKESKMWLKDHSNTTIGLNL